MKSELASREDNTVR